MFLHNYYCILLGYTSALQYRYFALPIWVSYISFIQSVNGVQFLNVVCLFLFPVCFASSSAPAPAIFMVPFTRMYASLLPQRLELSIRVLNLIWLFVMRLPIHHRLLQPNYFCAEFRWLMICVIIIKVHQFNLLLLFWWCLFLSWYPHWYPHWFPTSTLWGSFCNLPYNFNSKQVTCCFWLYWIALFETVLNSSFMNLHRSLVWILHQM